jgi:hypothetical protein
MQLEDASQNVLIFIAYTRNELHVEDTVLLGQLAALNQWSKLAFLDLMDLSSNA